ncbi:MAG TPA: type II secretion system F family protein [Candidatus Saccharimonadales bacterium]|jgi:type IV pilus assembly protein PilC|nr:type II secretion system F family protein [Candidatus Saccharimonadales bacterium]
MLTFLYTARDAASNKQIKSTVQAESERAAAKLLIAQGMTPLSITEQTQRANIFAKLAGRVTTKDRVIFTRQLATLINAGLPLAQSLHTVADQTENKRLRAVVQDIITSIEGGSSLGDSFGKHPEVFNHVFLALVAAGEASGTLDKALERIATQQEKDAEMLSKVRGALVYPVIVLVVIIGVIIFMLLSVVPQIERLYHDLKQSLPFITAAMVAIANFLIFYWWLVLILAGIIIYFIKRYIETDAGRRVIDTMKMRLPLFGIMFRKLYMARFTRTGQTLMTTGVPMLEMLRISAQAVNNVIVSQSILHAAEKVKGGKALSLALKGDDNILPLVPQMISIGEQSGGIDNMMGKAATFYENELDNTIRSISTAIEPVLMVILAAVAGLMVAAILLPVYGLISSGAIH